MKEYKFIRMTYRMLKGGYVTAKGDGYRNHRTVIRDMAEQGWRFVGNLPVDTGGYGALMSYDLVFEIDCEN
ncbi:MAG: DUF4177 domain-containing protein [Ruminococcus sp.]|nr:DUF4177 domain-containing protein [Ruminococcus sp.]